MLIWLCMLVPALAVAVCAVIFRHKIVWWEPLVLFGLSFAFVGVAKVTTETVQVSDTEYWGGYVTRAEYYEDWDEEVSCRHPIPCTHSYNCGTKNSPSTCYRHMNDGYEHAYDVDYHAPYWQMKDSNGETFTISSGFFEELAGRWHRRDFVDLHRSYHSKDGDKYVTEWDNLPESIEATATSHRYENRVQASQSTFRFPEVENPKALGLFDYPDIAGHRQRVILGADDPEAERKFQYLNATLGRPKQVRVYVLVYRNKPQDVAVKQEWYWQGGNKNEFVVAVGVDGEGNVQWARPFAWSALDEKPVRELLTETRMKLVDMGRLDLSALADWLYPQVQARFKRMPFARFSYLTVDPPGWVVVLVFVLTTLLSIGWAVWAVSNEHVSVHDDQVDAMRMLAHDYELRGGARRPSTPKGRPAGRIRPRF